MTFSPEVHGVRGDADVKAGSVPMGADFGLVGPGDAAEGAPGGVERGVVEGLQRPPGAAHEVAEKALPIIVGGRARPEVLLELLRGKAFRFLL